MKRVSIIAHDFKAAAFCRAFRAERADNHIPPGLTAAATLRIYASRSSRVVRK
jgi:hypothetical protein